MGPVRLRREWQPLEEVIGSAIASVEPALGTRRIVTDVPADLPLLNFDAVLIERVLANLLDNAIRHAPQGTIAIGARLAGERVSVDVDDEGPGLAPGAEASVFDAFERADASISGTGLGLAICRAIVAAHGGRIAATNRPQGGARFTFTLPVGTPPSIDEAVTERIAKGAV
jgi:two-component system sensor histidine kinase KdpD